jgi:DNA polymerase-1
VFALADFDQIELLALGQILLWWTGSSAMVEAVKAGRDLHVEVAAKLAGTSYESFAESLEAGERTSKELRQFAKVANYGFPGGLSSTTFSSYAQSFGLDISPAEAANIRRAWMEAWPEMRSYFDKIGLATSNSAVTIIQPVSERQRGGCTFTSAANSYFQGLVSDFAKQSLWEITKKCLIDQSSPLFGCHPCAFLHDEIIIEAPEDRAPEAAEEMARVMIEVAERYMPDVPVSASPMLAARWSKDAERVVENGRLVVWR